MPLFLRQSTASQEVPLGFFVDSTDGNTEETGLTIANTDIKIWKTGATTLANKNSGGATHITNGIYYAVFDATDTDIIGPIVIYCHPAGALATRTEAIVLDEAVYDTLFGTTALATTTNITAGTITTVTNLTTYTGNTVQTGDSFARIGAAGVGLTSVAVAVGGIQSTTFAAGAIDAAAIAADAIGSTELAQSAAQEIADEVLNRDLAGGGSGNTRNVRNALRAIRNKVSESGGTLTVTQEDDATPAWTATVTRSASTNPITTVDPA